MSDTNGTEALNIAHSPDGPDDWTWDETAGCWHVTVGGYEPEIWPPDEHSGLWEVWERGSLMGGYDSLLEAKRGALRGIRLFHEEGETKWPELLQYAPTPDMQRLRLLESKLYPDPRQPGLFGIEHREPSAEEVLAAVLATADNTERQDQIDELADDLMEALLESDEWDVCEAHRYGMPKGVPCPKCEVQ